MKKMSALLIVLIIGFAGISVLSRHVQPAKALYSIDHEIYIYADGSISPADAPITNVGNSTYTLTDDINITGVNSKGIVILRSNITFNGNGHTLTSSTGGNQRYGIWLYMVQNVKVENTTVNGFSDTIYLQSSSYNIIRGNDFSKGASVFYFQGANNNIIDKNNITNGAYGVESWYASTNNTFTRNYIANNTFWAIALRLGAGDCHFYHNIISGNVGASSGPACTWDNGYPSGGNYWIGYVSPDKFSGPYQNITGGDGIGDTPKAIDADDIDHYPFLMLNICNVSQTPPENNVLSTDMVEVNATVAHFFPLEQVILNCTCTNSSATWTSIINMTNLEDDIWNGVIPALPVGTNVTYVIIAQDNLGSSINSKSQGYTFEYPVAIPELPTFLILPLFMIASLLAVVVCKRKRSDLFKDMKKEGYAG